MKKNELNCINTHPNPEDNKIAIVLSYNDLQFIYNGFGQRLGVKQFPEIKHQMVFYSDQEIVVSDNENWITKYNSNFKEINNLILEQIDCYFVNPNYKRSFTLFRNTFFKMYKDEILSFFKMLNRNSEILETAGLTQKYNKYNILDMVAISEILNIENITRSMIIKLTKRIEFEMMKEISCDKQKIYLSVSDILYDEIQSWPFFIKLNTIVWDF